jgi:L-fucose isomerase-like protein
MTNLPKVRLGIVAVSRDCFPIELSRKRQLRVAGECRKAGLAVTRIPTVVENENDALKALEEVRAKGVNALVIYLGNFGPEGPTTILAQKFGGPVMVAAAAEESGRDLVDGRGDAYCGLLNTSYNVGLRKLRPYVPEYPVGTPEEVAAMIAGFVPVARVLLGLAKLKIFSFGPRPQDFLACNAPIKPLYDIGVEVMENSELDLYDIFLKAEGDPKIRSVAADMARELGAGNTYPDILAKLAQFEVALLKFMETNLGASRYGVFADKCWPAFESYFGFVPCYVNSRLAARGIPVACEVDIYGALSEYICTCATGLPATLLDINNTVPYDMIAGAKKAMKGYLEGRIKTGGMTIFRLQSTADTRLRSYMAEGEVLDIDPKSFGGIGVIGIKEMGRFYRHVLIEKRFPHHTAVAFAPVGKTLWAAMRTLGVEDISFNRPAGMLYPTENPF